MTEDIVLITGGSGKFGKKLIDHFLQKGNAVVFTATSQQSIEETLDQFFDFKEKLIGLEHDFTHINFVNLLLKQLINKNLHPTILINNARSLSSLNIEKKGVVKRDNFMREYLVDVVAPYELSMGLAFYDDSKLTSIVNIGSQYGVVAANPALYDDYIHQSPIHYGVAKAALIHLTRELAVRLADNKIRVNCVAFGGVEGRVDEEFKLRYAKLTPMKRMLREDEIIGPIDFLSSSSSSGMTGETIKVDGGWGVW